MDNFVSSAYADHNHIDYQYVANRGLSTGNVDKCVGHCNNDGLEESRK